jgi:hypothetical protein
MSLARNEPRAPAAKPGNVIIMNRSDGFRRELYQVPNARPSLAQGDQRRLQLYLFFRKPRGLR